MRDEATAKEAEALKKRSDSDDAAERLKRAEGAATAAATAAEDAKAAADKADRAALMAASESASATSGGSLTVNTNLEQISDWLTKIIVGVSLVESQALLSKIDGAAAFMARSMAAPESLARAVPGDREAGAAAHRVRCEDAAAGRRVPSRRVGRSVKSAPGPSFSSAQ